MKKLNKDERRAVFTALFHYEEIWQTQPLCENPGEEFVEELGSMLYEAGEALESSKVIPIDLIRKHLTFLLRAPGFIEDSKNENTKIRLQRALNRLEAEGF